MLSSSTPGGQLPFDGSWFQSVNDFARSTGWLHTPARGFAQYGVGLFAAALLWAWWWARGRRDVARVAAALWAPLGALVALGLNQPLVNGLREARPYALLPHVLVLVSRSSDYSFPSDHAVMAGAVAAGVFLVSRTWGLLTALLAVLMCVDRVYVGAHFPGDVLAGFVFGALVCLVGHAALKGPLERLVSQLARTPLRLLVLAGTPDSSSDEVNLAGRR